MKKYKNILFYISTIAVFTTLMYWIVLAGIKLEQGRNVVENVSQSSSWSEFINSLADNLQHPLAILLAQIITIIFVARFFGWVCKQIGQPAVVGEIIAGIALGPSLLGLYFPNFSSLLFPPESLDNLNFLSQIGLILFMFIIGMELDLKVLKNKARDAVVISHASIIFPFALGMGLSYFIYPHYAPQSVGFIPFALFMGIAMSITAFPVLARIVQERGIHKTKLGTIVITCAAADDITAWCILAAVIAIAKAGSFVSALWVIALAVAYVLFMIKLVRPFLRRIGELHDSQESMSKSVVAIFFLVLLMSACATEIIGIHALFGAFMAGAIMPESGKFRTVFINKIEDVAIVLLLPLFFVFTGLRTEIGLLNDPSLWKVTGLIISVAIVGKFVGSTLAARFVGQSWKDSLSIGALMNTRGLMELVVLNIGYDLGVLNAEIFAMMVIMALVTTFMTGPALSLINFIFKSEPDITDTAKELKVLISFASPENSKLLLRLATGLTGNMNDKASITALHLAMSEELSRYNAEEYEKNRFAAIVEESKELNKEISTIFRASYNIESDIAEITNQGEYDLLLLGAGQSIYEGSILGKIIGFTAQIIKPSILFSRAIGSKRNPYPFDERIGDIVAKTHTPVGVLINKDFTSLDRVFIPILSSGDQFLIQYAKKLIKNSNSQITILNIRSKVKDKHQIVAAVQQIKESFPNNVTLIKEELSKELIEQQSLVLTSAHSWRTMVTIKSPWLDSNVSSLILTSFPSKWDS